MVRGQSLPKKICDCGEYFESKSFIQEKCPQCRKDKIARKKLIQEIMSEEPNKIRRNCLKCNKAFNTDKKNRYLCSKCKEGVTPEIDFTLSPKVAKVTPSKKLCLICKKNPQGYCMGVCSKECLIIFRHQVGVVEVGDGNKPQRRRIV